MRAIGRLRLLSEALAQLQQQHADAAAECARFRAAAEPDAVGAPAPPHRRFPLEKLARERAEIEEQRERLHSLEEARCQAEQELAKVECTLAEERARSEALERRCEELAAQLDEQCRLTQRGPFEPWSQRAAQLQLDLKRALTDNGSLRDEMAGLLRFLEELSDALASSTAGTG